MHSSSKELPAWIIFFSMGFFLLLLLLGERLRPLRKETQNKFHRIVINFSIAAVSMALLRLCLFPIVMGVSKNAQYNYSHLISWMKIPRFAQVIVLLLCLDYSLYWWHRLNHKFSFLWRFHNVHHVDLDLDASTAFRFHFGELSMSVLFRILQVMAFGVDPFTLTLFEGSVLSATMFHHSNFRMSSALERILNCFVVTPRMHGVHHSIVRQETDSNFSTIFSFWDKLHRSSKLDVNQEEIIIGVPSYRNLNELSFLKSLAIPFQQSRKWLLPSGEEPRRQSKAKILTTRA